MINCVKLIILTQFHFWGGLKNSTPVFYKEHYFLKKAQSREELFSTILHF